MTDLTDEAVKALLDGATPGPWRADGEPWNRIVWSSADNRVCFMAHSSGLNDARDTATPNLVAAAPDLARALLAARAELDRLRTPAAEDTFPDMIRRVGALEGCGVRVKALEDFVSDFASAKIDALRYQPAYGESPEDEPDPVVDAETVWAWQADAKTALAALEPVAQPETPTPGQFTTMCLAIEDVVTGRGFDVAIHNEVKAHLRNALMVGGWRGERE